MPPMVPVTDMQVGTWFIDAVSIVLHVLLGMTVDDLRDLMEMLGLMVNAPISQLSPWKEITTSALW